MTPGCHTQFSSGTGHKKKKMKSKENMLHSVISSQELKHTHARTHACTHTHTHTHTLILMQTHSLFERLQVCNYISYNRLSHVDTFIPQCVQICCRFNFPESTDMKSQRPLSAQTILPTNLFGRDGELVGAIAWTEARADVTHNMRSIAIGQ